MALLLQLQQVAIPLCSTYIKNNEIYGLYGLIQEPTEDMRVLIENIVLYRLSLSSF